MNLRNLTRLAVVLVVFTVGIQILSSLSRAARSRNQREVSAAPSAFTGGTPVPRPLSAQGDLVRQVSLASNDIVYNPVSHLLYASVPSSNGANGNSITSIDPFAATLGSSVFVGSEPNKLALASDGNTLYAALDGAAAVRRFNVSNQTAGAQFSVGRSDTGVFFVNDMEVVPGSPDSLAISRKYIGISPNNAGVVIYDNGVVRPTQVNSFNSVNVIEFGAAPTTLYGYNNTGLSRVYRMAVNASGVSLLNEFNPGISFSGTDLKFDNGLLYLEYGAVINPETQALVGTYPGVVPALGAGQPLVEPDATVGRTYFLTGNNSNWTLRAFDQATFQPVGTLDITGVSGTPGNLTRFGSNGIAFRTNNKQLFLIQTSLIPSGDPIPSPSPTPTPSPSPTPTPEVFIRAVSLPSNGIVINQNSQMIYASVPSSAGERGNSLTQVNPVNGDLGSSFFVGSEPGRMDISDDGHTVYTILNGAGAIRRFDLLTNVVGTQFPVGYSSSDGVLTGSDLAVQPGNPNVVAVARRALNLSSGSGGVAFFENGVQRPSIAFAGGSKLEFSASPSVLYANELGSIQKISVNASGGSFTSSMFVPGSGDPKFANGLMYSPTGHVFDPETGLPVGRFMSFDLTSVSTVLPDLANNRVYFLGDDSALEKLHVFDAQTYLEIGSVNLGFYGNANSLLRWGVNGLAFSNGTQVVMLQTSLVSNAAPVPTPTPTPSPTPSPAPVVPAAAIQITFHSSNDIVYSSETKRIYASVPNSATFNQNSITSFDPLFGAYETSTFIGSDPNQLAISSDQKTLYAGIDGTGVVRSFDIPTLTPGAQFSVGSGLRAGDIEAMPGSPQTVAVSKICTCSPSYAGTTIYDNGVARPNQLPSHTGPSELAFSSSPSLLYGSGGDFYKLAVDSSGVTVTSRTAGLLFGDIKFVDGLVISDFGQLIEPTTPTLLGRFSANGPVVADASVGRAYFLSSDSGSSWTIKAFDLATFRPVATLPLPYISGAPTSLLRWGPNGLAFRTTGGQLYFIQTDMVPSTTPLPTFLQLSAPSYSASEAATSASVIVTRTGDTSTSAAIGYAVSNGTATGNEDFTPVGGTLNFAPGETSKTINIPIINDTVREGNETFSIVITHPAGGAKVGYPTSATVTIIDNDQVPRMTIDDMAVLEPSGGTTTAVFTVRLSNATTQSVTANFGTADGVAHAPDDYTSTSGTVIFSPLELTRTVSVTVNSDGVTEPNENFFVNLNSALNAVMLDPQGIGTIVSTGSILSFSSASYNVDESANSAVITVSRVGDLSDTVSCVFSTSDQTALQRTDYTLGSATVTFAPNQSSRAFSVLITDDVYQESSETFGLSLFSPSATAVLGTAAANATILDNDSSEPTTNPADEAQFFVRQHYYDFLSRTPDQGGFTFWTDQITQCGSDPACIHTKRVDVSNAFYYELEYQQTGSYVYRLYRAAFGDNQPFPNPFPNAQFPNEEKKIPNYSVFAPDRARVRGGASLAQTQLDLANNFVQRPAFLLRYPASFDGPTFVDAILATLANDIGANLSSQRQALLTLFNQGGRGAVLYRLADDNVQTNPIDNRAFIDTEYNRAFVITQYFGYLRRNPDIAGFVFWLGQVNGAPLRDVPKQHSMVCSFITSAEYQQRFSSVVTHNNSECAP
ncbi:MAG TPA: Calx-beta domain-containing protein [Pyrinomonadaceae bacterium]|nr:Calx-beta domain-containing protein [Pyrinomonadaceae bacterium]